MQCDPYPHGGRFLTAQKPCAATAFRRVTAKCSPSRYRLRMAIEFDVEELIGKVDAITATQLPYAGGRAMFQLANILRTEAWPSYARVNFDRPVPLTTSGLIAKADGLTVTLSFDRIMKSGQDPARYLAPVHDGGAIYVTTFTRKLTRMGVMPNSYKYARANKGSLGLAGQINEYGNVNAGFYKSVITALERKAGEKTRSKYGDSRFFSVPDGRRPAPKSQRLTPGIYRQKGGLLSKIFTYETDLPTVGKRWDFEEFADISTKELLPGLLSKALDEAMR